MKTKLFSVFLLFTIIIIFTTCSKLDEIACPDGGRISDDGNSCDYSESHAELEKRLQEENDYIAEKDDYLASEDEK